MVERDRSWYFIVRPSGGYEEVDSKVHPPYWGARSLTASQAFEAVLAVEDFLPPGFVVEVPLDGLAEAGGVVVGGGPAQVVFYFGGVDGVAEVVAGAVGDEGDLVGVGFAFGAGAEFVEEGAEEADEIDVAEFVVAADVVGFADFSLGDGG